LAAQKLRAHAEREGFALEVAVEPDLPPVRFDRDALLPVLFNLVDNAMKYAGAGTRRCVVLEARRGGDDVEISVRDFGPGVSGPPDLPRRGDGAHLSGVRDQPGSAAMSSSSAEISRRISARRPRSSAARSGRQRSVR